MSPKPDDIIQAFDEILDYVYGRSRGRDYPSKDDPKIAQAWIDEGLTVPIACCVFYQRMSMMHERWLRQNDQNDKTNIPRNIGVFDENIRAAIVRAKAGGESLSMMDIIDSRWRSRLKGFYSAKKYWYPDLWGPEPGQDGCRASPRLIAEINPKEKKTAVV